MTEDSPELSSTPEHWRETHHASWTQRRGQNDRAVYVNVRCAACQEPLEPVWPDNVDEHGQWEELLAHQALHVRLGGAYGELLDSYDGDIEIYLCRKCTQRIAQANPWLETLLADHLDINVAHRCGDIVRWEAQTSCPHDPDQHGWRRVWVLTHADRPGVRQVFDTEQAADIAAAALPGAQVHESLIGNERHDTHMN